MTDNDARRNLASCGCGAQWGGNKTSHCTACHNTFTGLTAFDAHRPGNCDLTALVVVRKSGNQQVWGLPDTTGRWSGGTPDPQRGQARSVQLSDSVQDLLARVQQAQADLTGSEGVAS